MTDILEDILAQKQINLKVESQLFSHLCKKAQRNNMSNPEFIRKLIELDMKSPSDGDKEMLNRFGYWAAKETSKRVINDIESTVALALKTPFDKFQGTVKQFITSIDSSNHKQFNETASMIAEVRSMGKQIEQRERKSELYRKKQFTNLYILLGGNLFIQGVLFIKWVIS